MRTTILPHNRLRKREFETVAKECKAALEANGNDASALLHDIAKNKPPFKRFNSQWKVLAVDYALQAGANPQAVDAEDGKTQAHEHQAPRPLRRNSWLTTQSNPVSTFIAQFTLRYLTDYDEDSLYNLKIFVERHPNLLQLPTYSKIPYKVNVIQALCQQDILKNLQANAMHDTGFAVDSGFFGLMESTPAVDDKDRTAYISENFADYPLKLIRAAFPQTANEADMQRLFAFILKNNLLAYAKDATQFTQILNCLDATHQTKLLAAYNEITQYSSSTTVAEMESPEIRIVNQVIESILQHNVKWPADSDLSPHSYLGVKIRLLKAVEALSDDAKLATANIKDASAWLESKIKTIRDDLLRKIQSNYSIIKVFTNTDISTLKAKIHAQEEALTALFNSQPSLEKADASYAVLIDKIIEGPTELAALQKAQAEIEEAIQQADRYNRKIEMSKFIAQNHGFSEHNSTLLGSSSAQPIAQEVILQDSKEKSATLAAKKAEESPSSTSDANKKQKIELTKKASSALKPIKKTNGEETKPAQTKVEKHFEKTDKENRAKLGNSDEKRKSKKATVTTAAPSKEIAQKAEKAKQPITVKETAAADIVTSAEKPKIVSKKHSKKEREKTKDSQQKDVIAAPSKKGNKTKKEKVITTKAAAIKKAKSAVKVSSKKLQAAEDAAVDEESLLASLPSLAELGLHTPSMSPSTRPKQPAAADQVQIDKEPVMVKPSITAEDENLLSILPSLDKLNAQASVMRATASESTTPMVAAAEHIEEKQAAVQAEREAEIFDLSFFKDFFDEGFRDQALPALAVAMKIYQLSEHVARQQSAAAKQFCLDLENWDAKHDQMLNVTCYLSIQPTKAISYKTTLKQLSANMSRQHAFKHSIEPKQAFEQATENLQTSLNQATHDLLTALEKETSLMTKIAMRIRRFFKPKASKWALENARDLNALLQTKAGNLNEIAAQATRKQTSVYKTTATMLEKLKPSKTAEVQQPPMPQPSSKLFSTAAATSEKSAAHQQNMGLRK